ncbi:response regulator transcription factor [Streptomyces hyaluromycini]|uniref:response regulator transcription factor n=1 Tax=Streptomyces hyaluromycini TaxID=1377993 RepID=UPI000B5C5CC5|nr:response regulator transcription factor [Streptomyces hyaluromycini]
MAGATPRSAPPAAPAGPGRTEPRALNPLSARPHPVPGGLGGDQGHGRSPSEGADAADTVRLAVHAADPITRSALVSYLRRQPGLTLTGRDAPADIVVAALQDPDARTLTHLSQEAEGAARLVVIVDGEWSVDPYAALEAGVRAVLFRPAFTWERFGEALQEVRAGHGDLPAALQGQLMDQMTRTHQEVLAPHGLTPGGLTQREAEVLQLVSEGDELQHIGDKLGYSERTIKNVLYGMIKRHRLRNRAHAVAYAIRSGQI